MKYVLLGCLVAAAVWSARADDYPIHSIYGEPGRSPLPDYGGSDSYKDSTVYGSSHQLAGNAPYGAFVERAADPTMDFGCSGTFVERIFYGSTISHNSAMASDPTSSQCDESQEEGDPIEAGGLVEYLWTVYPDGSTCGDQGLGEVTLTDGRKYVGGVENSEYGNPVTVFICDKTHHWTDYELARYGDTHPLYGEWVRPTNVCKKNYNWLTGLQKMQTWGCDWIRTARMYCLDANGDVAADTDGSKALCTAACYGGDGCGPAPADDATADDYVWKKLLLEEVVVEVELDPQGTHPPDVYLWKPLINEVPDGLPEAFEQAYNDASPDWYTDSFLEARLNTLLSASFAPALKESLLGGPLEEAGDVLTSLSTDNFGPGAVSEVTQPQTFVLFDDHAATPVSSVTGWASGAYAPEDMLRTFQLRMKGVQNGGGTWVLVTVDDCDANEGAGAEVVTWQLHFVCKEPGFCKQSATPSPPPPAGSGSGDPHMVGFRGQAFDYHGAPGEFFNVVSTPATQLNAFLQPELLDGLTYMGSIGLVLEDGGKLQVTALRGLDAPLVELNDRIVTEDTREGALSVAFEDGGRAVRVESPELTLVASLHKGQFIDVRSVELRTRPERIHGVLGNTANLPPEQDMAGEDEDYFVSHMWASDFKHNVFRAGAGRPRAARIGALVRQPAFELTDIMAARMVNIETASP